MHDNQLDHVMVVGDDGRAVGTFSREELVQWLVQQTSGARRSVANTNTNTNTMMAGMPARRLRDVMHPAISVRRRASLLTARDLLTTHDLHELPVLEAGRVVGLVFEADIYSLIAAHRDDEAWVHELLVEDVMKPAPASHRPDDSLESVLAALAAAAEGDEASRRERESCLLVEQDGRLIGVVSTRELRGRPDLLDPGVAGAGAGGAGASGAAGPGAAGGRRAELNLR
jgi:CBS domain-containing protein